MQPRSSIKKRKTCYSALLHFISHCNPKVLILAYLALSAPATLANEAYQVSEHPASFLKPGTHDLIVNKKDCVQAAPRCLIEAAPLKNPRLFQLWQSCDSDKVDKLKQKSFENQITDMKFVGKDFCNGVVSFDEPKSSSSTDAQDPGAKKAIALIDKLQEYGDEIITILDKLKSDIAIPAREGGPRDHVVAWTLFNQHIKELEEIRRERKFGNAYLFIGNAFPIEYGHEPRLAIEILTVGLLDHITSISNTYTVERHQTINPTDTLARINELNSLMTRHFSELQQQRNILFRHSAIPEFTESSIDLNYPDRVVAHRSLRR
ncbi:MAG: hypothetical protein ACYCQI_08790 [Gammaproteobacteria bacterium]